MRKTKDNHLPPSARSGNKAQIRKALEEGSNPNLRGPTGRTPLHWAAQEGFVGIVRRLIKHGAELDAVNDLGFTALAVAAGEGKSSIVRELLAAGASPNIRNWANANGTALHLACSWGHREVAKILIEKGGADVNVRDANGKTALAYALDAGDGPLAAYLRKRGALP